jgi:hypothetical protein
LDDEELGIVMALATPLHPIQRGAFLEAVAQEAAKHGELGPGLLNRIARAIQKDFLSPPTRVIEPAGATRQQARGRRPAREPA